MKAAKVLVLSESLIMVSGIHAEQFEALREYLKVENIKLTVVAFGDAEFMDTRKAPVGIRIAAQKVINWLEAHP